MPAALTTPAPPTPEGFVVATLATFAGATAARAAPVLAAALLVAVALAAEERRVLTAVLAAVRADRGARAAVVTRGVAGAAVTEAGAGPTGATGVEAVVAGEATGSEGATATVVGTAAIEAAVTDVVVVRLAPDVWSMT